jgi:DNA-directed RNA polymerase subunit M/transcription elongation factor TFIIS
MAGVMKKCPKCQTDLHERVIGPKRRSACPRCSYLSYENLGKAGYDIHIENIIAGVVKTGAHEIALSQLANTSFQEHFGGHTTLEQIEEWCKMHEFDYTVFQGKDVIGHKVKMVRFSRALT